MSTTATLVNKQLQVIHVTIRNGEDLITLIAAEDYEFLQRTHDIGNIRRQQILKNISKKLGIDDLDGMEVQ